MRYAKRAIQGQIRALERVASNEEERIEAAYWRRWFDIGLENLQEPEPQAVNFATAKTTKEEGK